jgi:hypothetical protein
MKAKRYEQGGAVMAEAMGEIPDMGKMGSGSGKKKNLPSEDISPLQKEPRKNLIDSAKDTVKSAGKRLKDNVMGTKEQNMKAEADEKRRAKENPEGNEAKFRKMMGKKDEFKSGGSVSSASKRADGCAIRGKTKA